MSTITVKIIGHKGRALRAMYGSKDVSGPGIGSDPIVAEATRAWFEDGAPEAADIDVTVSATKPKVETVSVAAPAEIVAIGGGVYELPDGRRIKGKKKALAALAAA